MNDMALLYFQAKERFHSKQAFSIRSNVEAASKKGLGRLKDVTGFWAEVDITFTGMQATSSAVTAYEQVIKKSLEAHEQRRGLSFLAGHIKPPEHLLLEFKSDEEVNDMNTDTHTPYTYRNRCRFAWSCTCTMPM
jgi:hypothetical protein